MLEILTTVLIVEEGNIVEFIFLKFAVNFPLNVNSAYFVYSHQGRGITSEHCLTYILYVCVLFVFFRGGGGIEILYTSH